MLRDTLGWDYMEGHEDKRNLTGEGGDGGWGYGGVGQECVRSNGVKI